MMKNILLAILLLSVLAPLARAASDCAHTCCRTYNGSWDKDFDDCRAPAGGGGFDQCVSQCEAQVAASGPHGPGPASPENTYNCKVGAILATIAVGAFLMGKN